METNPHVNQRGIRGERNVDKDLAIEVNENVWRQVLLLVTLGKQVNVYCQQRTTPVVFMIASYCQHMPFQGL